MVAGVVAIHRIARQTVVMRTGVVLYIGLATGSLLMSLAWGRLGLPVETPAAFPMRFYQHIIGPMDGKACPSYPVCSLYARQAAARHGFLVGSWLALGRLIHEGDDLRRARWVRVDGKVYSYDPLSRNDFWIGR